jgi:hypothetical protein
MLNELGVPKRLADRGQRVRDRFDLVEVVVCRGVQLLAVAELATKIIASGHGLLSIALLERAPDVVGGGDKQHKAGDALHERGLQCRDDSLVLGDPGGVEGVFRLHPRAVRRQCSDRTRQTGETPIDEPIESTAAKKRQDLRAPVQIIIRFKTHSNQIG